MKPQLNSNHTLKTKPRKHEGEVPRRAKCLEAEVSDFTRGEASKRVKGPVPVYGMV